MATASSKDALTFKLSSISTVTASCERFAPLSTSGSGRFLSKLALETKQVPDKDDTVHVSLTLDVSGVPKESAESLAFKVSCCVDSEVRFSRPQSDELPPRIAEYIGSMLFQVAGERCRAMIFTMGYPGHALGTSPPRFTSDDIGPSEPVFKAAKKSSARPTRASKAK